MNRETDDKIETIIISAVNRLYNKESTLGLDIEDLKCLEILYKIKKEAVSTTNNSAVNSPEIPYNLIDLLRSVKGSSSNDNDTQG